VRALRHGNGLPTRTRTCWANSLPLLDLFDFWFEIVAHWGGAM